ncbi:Mediator of RNA polymerase II transcription subunit 21 [Neolecta irregularis DAH-3]|uniref:Mediator of RNA polymerase II transcription subunit 21 n=1 Tax=Neolecta irregularis (strain DAH-3) TaxID=1198029 RepID=A0A1U7LNN3_NEOID|nr:Mediator of RNA polymerase II transcription subunit 21 [Neolecta irregularis DAH-3]|eukprot:OLL24265.1 Mediator of RNA polymerase II transcription subunit 21 [Neolecta irregularis DAH-3]
MVQDNCIISQISSCYPTNELTRNKIAYAIRVAILDSHDPHAEHNAEQAAAPQQLIAKPPSAVKDGKTSSGRLINAPMFISDGGLFRIGRLFSGVSPPPKLYCMDRITQLQDALDQLAIRFYSTLNHLNTQHDFVPFPGQTKATDPHLQVSSAEEFDASKRELAKDIVSKAREIDLLIESLPGITATENEQMERIRNLQVELDKVQQEQKQVFSERDILRTRLDELITSFASQKGSAQD